MVQSLEQNPQGAQQVIWHVPCSLKSCCYRFTLLVPCFAWATAVCGRLHCPICIMFSTRLWNSRLYNVVSLATITSTQEKLLNFFQSKAYRRLGGSSVGVQRAQNTKSIFYLAENFSHGVVCPSARRSQVNSLSIHHGHVPQAVIQAGPRQAPDVRRVVGRTEVGNNELTGEMS